MLFVITGPSGSGKSTLVRRVLKELKDIEFSVSLTTRKKRSDEKEGEDYYFVTEDRFKQLIQEKMLMEWTVIHGHYYGTAKREIEKKGIRSDLILDIDVQGARQIKAKAKKAVFIFILPPVFQELKRRLEKRGEESEEAIQKRLNTAKKEIRFYHQFDYVIVNDDLETSVEDLKAIILSVRCRLDIRQKEIMPILRSFSGEE